MIDFDKMLILDGATGSLLTERSGAPAGYRPEMLNVENPDVVYSVHRDYVEAGSDVVYTNTFGANPLKLGDETGKIIRAAISIARRAAEGKAYVALDVGPLGKLIGEGGISFEEAYENYAAVIKAAEDKTDLIVIETMTDIADARAALLAAKVQAGRLSPQVVGRACGEIQAGDDRVWPQIGSWGAWSAAVLFRTERA